MVIVRLFEQWRQHASENLMRAISVERIELNVFVGESGDVEWLLDKFNLDLSLVARLGGHSALTVTRSVPQA